MGGGGGSPASGGKRQFQRGVEERKKKKRDRKIPETSRWKNLTYRATLPSDFQGDDDGVGSKRVQ